MSGGSGGAAAPQYPHTPAPQSNWFTDWVNRTPPVTRYAIYITVPLTVLTFFVGALADNLFLTASTFLRGQVWRLLTSPLTQGGVLTLLIVVLMLALMGPSMESDLGSMRFLMRTLIGALTINVLWAAIVSLLVAVAPGALVAFASLISADAMVSAGLWPVLMYHITLRCLADPSGSTAFCTFRMSNKIYPWVLVAIFSLISFGIQLDLLLGVLLGHAHAFGLSRVLEPSAARMSSWETGNGWAVRTKFTLSPAYALPPAGGAMSQPSGGGLLSMFSRNQGQTGTTPAAGPRFTGGGRVGGDAEAGTGSSYMVQAGRGRGGASTNTEPTFTGTGQVLGAAPTAASAAPVTAAHGTGAADAARAAAAAAARARLGQLQPVSESDEVTGRESEDTEDERGSLLAHASGSAQAPSRATVSMSMDDKVARLVALGHPEPVVRDALQRTQGDMPAALRIIITKK